VRESWRGRPEQIDFGCFMKSMWDYNNLIFSFDILNYHSLFSFLVSFFSERLVPLFLVSGAEEQNMPLGWRVLC